MKTMSSEITALLVSLSLALLPQEGRSEADAGFPAGDYTPYGYLDNPLHFKADESVGVSKIWAYGDVFALGASQKALAEKATSSEKQWTQWIAANDLSSNAGANRDVSVKDARGSLIATAKVGDAIIEFSAQNGSLYHVSLIKS